MEIAHLEPVRVGGDSSGRRFDRGAHIVDLREGDGWFGD
jgi:hypothetical protein